MDKRMERVTKGNETTMAAIIAAGKENAILIPNQLYNSPPIHPLVPKIRSKIYPVVTGGRTNGKCKNPSTNAFPKKCLRAKNQPIKMARGSTKSVHTNATFNDSCIAVSSEEEYVKSSFKF